MMPERILLMMWQMCWPLTFHFAPVDVTLDSASFERCWHAGGRETEWHQPCWPKWTFTKAFLRMRVSHFTFRIFEAWANEKDGSWAQSVGRRRQELNLECHPRSFEKLVVVPQHDHSWSKIANTWAGSKSYEHLPFLACLASPSNSLSFSPLYQTSQVLGDQISFTSGLSPKLYTELWCSNKLYKKALVLKWFV